MIIVIATIIVIANVELDKTITMFNFAIYFITEILGLVLGFSWHLISAKNWISVCQLLRFVKDLSVFAFYCFTTFAK